jgi:hypothetical protein
VSNDADTLRGYVESALQDESNATWTADQLDTLVVRAVASLAPRVVKWVAADDDDASDTLVESTYFYAAPTGFLNIARIQWVDTNGFERGDLKPGTWRTTGSFVDGTAKVQISPQIVDGAVGATIRYEGYARYDLEDNLIPDDYVAYVVAHAKAAAYSWMLSRRARFQSWANADQTLNVSVNELLGLQSQAERERDVERSRIFTHRKPMPAR